MDDINQLVAALAQRAERKAALLAEHIVGTEHTAGWYVWRCSCGEVLAWSVELHFRTEELQNIHVERLLATPGTT